MEKRISRQGILRGLTTSVLFVYTIVVLVPFLWTVAMSLRSTKDILINPYGISWPPFFQNYVLIFTNFGIFRYITNSVVVTMAALVIATIASTMAAYVFGRLRYHFRLREPLFNFIFLSMMFPPQISLLSLFQILVNYRLYNTLWGLIFVYAASALPLNIFLIKTFFSQIPQDIEDACQMDGANDWQMFWRVMFPIARPIIATTIIFNFIIFWNEFLYAVTFVSKQESRTLPLAVMFFMGESGTDLGMLAAGLIISILPIIVLYIILSEQFIKGMTAGSIKGG